MTMPPAINPEDWVTVRVLADATGNSTSDIYRALYDANDPMPCARNGRAIRVRLADWRAYWDRRLQVVIVKEPPRAQKGRTAETPA